MENATPYSNERYLKQLCRIERAAPADRFGLFRALCRRMVRDQEDGRVPMQTVGYVVFGMKAYPELNGRSDDVRNLFRLAGLLELPDAHMPKSAQRLWSELKEEIAKL